MSGTEGLEGKQMGWEGPAIKKTPSWKEKNAQAVHCAAFLTREKLGLAPAAAHARHSRSLAAVPLRFTALPA